MKTLLILTSLITLASIEVSASCTYSLIDDTQKVTWTGFKFTEKTGVSGTFDTVKVKHKTSDSIQELLKSISFEIDTKSINSGNPGRDATLQKTVFGFLSMPETIKGSVVESDDKNLAVKMTLNEEMTTSFNYTAKDGVISAEGDLDLTKNGLLKSFQAVKKACEALHTGSDGVSKTWSEVHIKLVANYEEKCSKGIIESVKDWFGS